MRGARSHFFCVTERKVSAARSGLAWWWWYGVQAWRGVSSPMCEVKWGLRLASVGPGGLMGSVKCAWTCLFARRRVCALQSCAGLCYIVPTYMFVLFMVCRRALCSWLRKGCVQVFELEFGCVCVCTAHQRRGVVPDLCSCGSCAVCEGLFLSTGVRLGSVRCFWRPRGNGISFTSASVDWFMRCLHCRRLVLYGSVGEPISPAGHCGVFWHVRVGLGALCVVCVE